MSGCFFLFFSRLPGPFLLLRMGDGFTAQRLLELTCEALLRVHCLAPRSWCSSSFLLLYSRKARSY